MRGLWRRAGGVMPGAAILGILVGGCSDQGPDMDTPPYPQFGEVRTIGDHREMEIRFQSDGAVLTGTLFVPATGSDVAATALNPGSGWDARSPWTDVGGFVQALDVGVFSMFNGLDTEETSDEPPAASHCSFRFYPRELAHESLIILGLVERPIEARGAHFERVGRLNRIFHVEQKRQALADALAVFEADSAANFPNVVRSVPSILDAFDEDPKDPASPC